MIQHAIDRSPDCRDLPADLSDDAVIDIVLEPMLPHRGDGRASIPWPTVDALLTIATSGDHFLALLNGEIDNQQYLHARQLLRGAPTVCERCARRRH